MTEQFSQEEWTQLYTQQLGHSLSDKEKFFKAIETYGYWPMYEAIYISGLKNFDKDPLGYVLAIAHSKWKEQKEEELLKQRYLLRIEAAKERSTAYNEALAAKIEKAKRKRRKDESSSI